MSLYKNRMMSLKDQLIADELEAEAEAKAKLEVEEKIKKSKVGKK
jgi:hypothetical protein